jgi:predicted transcriptional regulator YdeE
MIGAKTILVASCALCVVQIALHGQVQASAVSQDMIDKPFYVAGCVIRTNNADEIGGNGKIGPLWQRFMQQNLAGQIPNRSGSSLIVVYSNYASDEKGDYDYLLGVPVSSVGDLPAGVTLKKVEPGAYGVILTEKGQMPGVLQAAWARVWKMSPAELGGKRAFVTDYEIYDQRSANMQSAQVEIHVGLASAAH